MEATYLDPRYRAALQVSALLNAAMVVLEGGVGWVIGSAALIADAADFLEDAAMYTLAIVALAWTKRLRAVAGIVQALAMASVGAIAITQIIERLLAGGYPAPMPMALTAVAALAVNVYSARRLMHFRGGDASMRSVWLSTRNDAILNALTILSAGIVAITLSGWPDIVAGGIIATINLWAAGAVLLMAGRELSSHAPNK